MTDVPVLETERLRLRGWVDDDLDALAEMCADRELMRWVGEPDGLDRAGAWRQMGLFLGHWLLRGYGIWAVEERASGRLVGRVGLWRPEGWPGLEVGWLIARPWQRRGYATEAGRAALGFAFERLGADKAISIIEPANEPSARVAHRLGERPERTIPWDGREAAIWSITARRWRETGG